MNNLTRTAKHQNILSEIKRSNLPDEEYTLNKPSTQKIEVDSLPMPRLAPQPSIIINMGMPIHQEPKHAELKLDKHKFSASQETMTPSTLEDSQPKEFDQKFKTKPTRQV